MTGEYPDSPEDDTPDAAPVKPDTPETIRQKLATMRHEIHAGLKDSTGDWIWREMVDLTVLLANVGEICADAEYDYNRELERWMFGCEASLGIKPRAPAKSAAAAKIRAEATQAWYEMQWWEREREGVVELVNALKKRFNEIAEEHGANRGNR